MALIADIDMSLADAVLPALPAASHLTIHTGNIINRQFISKKSLSTTEEIKRALTCTLDTWVKAVNKHDTKLLSEVDVDKNWILNCNNTILDRRDELKLTVKLFVVNSGPACVKEALMTVCAKLGTKHIETVIMSLPDVRPGTRYEQYRSYWEAAQQLTSFSSVPNGRNSECQSESPPDTHSPRSAGAEDIEISWTLGVADMDFDGLKDICSKAEVKPAIDQLNVDICCSPPDEIVSFCKEHEIQLHTHNDPREVLPQADVDDVINRVLSHEKDVVGWRVGWVLRYSTLVKCRGIIHSKGYLVHLFRALDNSVQSSGDPSTPGSM